ncbi:hypothetical protein Tco_1273814 [Tanacetum coccineum]
MLILYPFKSIAISIASLHGLLALMPQHLSKLGRAFHYISFNFCQLLQEHLVTDTMLKLLESLVEATTLLHSQHMRSFLLAPVPELGPMVTEVGGSRVLRQWWRVVVTCGELAVTEALTSSVLVGLPLGAIFLNHKKT